MQIKLFHKNDPNVFVTVEYTTDANGSIATAKVKGGSGNIDKQNEIIASAIINSQNFNSFGTLKNAVTKAIVERQDKDFDAPSDIIAIQRNFDAFQTPPQIDFSF